MSNPLSPVPTRDSEMKYENVTSPEVHTFSRPCAGIRNLVAVRLRNEGHRHVKRVGPVLAESAVGNGEGPWFRPGGNDDG
jgi:hypothetical protein